MNNIESASDDGDGETSSMRWTMNPFIRQIFSSTNPVLNFIRVQKFHLKLWIIRY
ncbi:MAG: hypothetical protein OEV66_09055 [Spirochaetia bacterium]|nr:hypothetical protein [Spirochaetia bacterium]